VEIKKEPLYCVPDVYWQKLVDSVKDKWTKSKQKALYIEEDDNDAEEIPNFQKESI
jgi:hypothetical protein